MADRSMPSSFDDDREYNETGFQKIGRKLREEPLIPLGTLLTTLAVYNAWRAMRRGDHAQVQRMFRARIGAQAFTVMAIVAGGTYYGADREKRKELIKLEAQQRAEERHQKWLKELEVRDEEDKHLKAAMKRRQDRIQQRRAEERGRVAVEEGKTGSGVGEEEEKKDGGSNVLGALSSAGGWFGTKKSENPTTSEQSKAREGGSEKKA
ncbi:hypoxia induced protein conserved region-domain-containing protein [Daldinia loculata]|uniref:hypoxia induced protein conserved region-domain-containing protein n=1 Tax=Daldinia loculata TaxID=103429 RepID=UPI0020C59DBC|nr:hypoxia induced protein conserved region-domain-containing protein [Daldinia loculata]KAI1642700.1 hypoxia induced protein conserved region-domain-containing protein [Daldinia loculata]KAI2769694.1 hypoxia induced protein conserved region-domain-containing protein [Daldinia loculata]